jgi:serine/threonine protein kinase/WD40 repeat protein
MTAPATIDDFLDLVRRSNQVDAQRLEDFIRRSGAALPAEPRKLAALMVREGLLTGFQAEQLLLGKWRGFTLGGYRVLERLGAGGTGTVYLAEHEVMRRRVAIKVLPAHYAEAPGVLERFRREAQAVAALDHPNIVRAYDFRQEGALHFLVMEYVDGASLQQLLAKQGPLAIPQACDYARQAAEGLEHAHEAGLVHRDIKPANLLVDRAGTVKLLDLGLARYAPDGSESVTKQFDDNAVMGTADYLAPEQALNLHAVDIRADIYSLGTTLYALLAGQPPFSDGTVTQKLLWHQMRDPRPLRELRPEVPAELAQVVARMMAKKPEDRYPTPAEVADALSPWCLGPVPPRLEGRAPGGSSGGSSARLRRPPSRAVASTRHGASVDTRAAEADATARLEPVRATPLRPPPRVDNGWGWVAILCVGSLTLAVLATAGIGYFLWRAVNSAKPPAVVVKPDDEEQVPVMPVDPPFELPAGEPGRLLYKLDGHTAAVLSVAFSPRGNCALSGGADRVLRLWDLKAPKAPPVLLHGHRGDVTHVAIAPHGVRAASASADGTVRLWELPSGRCLHEIKGHAGRVRWVAFTPDSLQVLSCGDDGMLRQGLMPDGKELRKLEAHKKGAYTLAINPIPRRQVVTAGGDRDLRLWDIDRGWPLKTFARKQPPINDIAYFPDGKRILCACGDGKLRVWDVDRAQLKATLDGHPGAVLAVAVTPEGRRAVSGGTDRVIRVYDLKTMKRLGHRFEGHAGEVTGLACSPQGKHFISCSKDRSVRVWCMPR